MDDLLEQSKQNFQDARSGELGSEVLSQSSIDWFRMLLIKKGSYNSKEFLAWALENKQQDFYDLVKDDVAYLQKINILSSEDGVSFKFRNERTKDTLFSFHEKSVEKNTHLIKMLSNAKDDAIFSLLTKDKMKRFEDEVLTAKDEIEKYLAFASKFPVSDFGNTIVAYLDSRENNLASDVIMSRHEWINSRVDGESVTILNDAKSVTSLNSIVSFNKVIGYTPFEFFDISQTSLSKEQVKFINNFSDDEILKRVNDAISSSKIISSVIGDGWSSGVGSLEERVGALAEKISERYFMSEDERDLFTFSFASSFGFERELKDFDLSGVKGRVRNVLSVLSLVKDELLLSDIQSKHILKDDLYLQLGKKDSEVLTKQSAENKMETLSDEDRVSYKTGFDFSKINLRGSVQLSREILANENIAFETNFENLFLVTKKLTIKSGDFKGVSFVVEDSFSDGELKEIVARDFLSKLVERKLLINNLDVKRIKDEFKRNEKLFGREYSDDTRRLYDERGYKRVSEIRERGDSLPDAASKSTIGNGRDELIDGAGVQRERGLGDSENRDSVQLTYVSDAEAEKIHKKFKSFVKALSEGYPVLGATGIYNILEGKNEFITVYDKKTVGEFIRVTDFEIFGVKFENQSLFKFKEQIEQGEAVKKYKDEWFFSDSERAAVLDAGERGGFEVKFSDDTYKKMFNITRKEAAGQSNSHLTIKLSPEYDLGAALAEMQNFRDKYPLLESENSVVQNKDADNKEKSSFSISDEYKPLFDGAVFRVFEHTKTGEKLDVIDIKTKLSKDAFIAFNKYLTSNEIGYYSRFAKGFVIADENVLSLAKGEERGAVEKDSALDDGLAEEQGVKSEAVAQEQERGLSEFNYSSVISDEEIQRRGISLDLIRNAEFIKKKTGLDYEIRHYQDATFLTAELEFSCDSSGGGNCLFRAVGNKEDWSVKERWIGSGINRKGIIKRINEALEKEGVVFEAVLVSDSILESQLEDYSDALAIEESKADVEPASIERLRGIVKEVELSISDKNDYLRVLSLIEDSKSSKELTSVYYRARDSFYGNKFNEKEHDEFKILFDKKFIELESLKKDEDESREAFSQIKSLKLIWTENSRDENISFESFDELQKYLEDFSEIPTNGSYVKSKFEIILTRESDDEELTLSPRIDVSASKGDFNPLKQNIRVYLSEMYAEKIDTNEGLLVKVNFENALFEKIEVIKESKEEERLVVKEELGGFVEGGENFSIESDISAGGAKTKFKNYLAGIAVVRKIEVGEEISNDERVVLSKMPGVGTIAQAFPRSDGSVVKGWENEVILLKESLSDAEYKQAQRATLDAYYTDESIIKAMWKGIDNFGFKGGSVLEPSVGVGNFFGYMPKHLKPNTMLLGVELDKTTSKVAQALYPKAKIYNVGFENFKLLEGQKASLVIGNPPYGAHKISDRNNPDLDGKNIHNYFMGKGVDSLEEGGVMAMVVSSGFLDSSDISTRAYVGKSANLVGAIRLPKGSFGNANTEIVTDIVFFQKREIGMQSNLADWLHVGSINDTPINGYYEKNPDNLLGIWGKYGTMYRGDEPGLIAREGQDTQALLDVAIEGLPVYYNHQEGVYSRDNKPSSTSIIWKKGDVLANNSTKESGNVLADGVRINAFFVNNDKIYKRLPNVNGESVTEEITTRADSKGGEITLSESDMSRIKGMIKISDIGSRLRVMQLEESVSDGELGVLRDSLNAEYDGFVKEFGYLNRNVNARLFEEDVNAPFLLALERKYDKGVSAAVAKASGGVVVKESAEKADIFFTRTQAPYRAPTSAASYEDALNVCLGEKAFVDLKYISSLLGKNEEDAEAYLSDNDFIFDDPNEGWVTKEAYLSGNVKAKYKEAQNSKNLEALEAVIPKDIPAVDINVACGATWVPAKDVGDFVKEIAQSESDINCFYTPLNASWNMGYMRSSNKSDEEFGTKRKSVSDILLAALNNKQLTVYDTIGSGADAQKVVNQDETTAANDKIDLIKEKWAEWIWESPERRERLGRMYNDKFNVYAKREYDGSHLTLPGKIDDGVISLRPHQKNAVWRALQNGRNLFDHTVGSGKTYSAIASVMEMKRTEKAKKPLVVVPKHLVGQWGREWLELYPSANILIPSEKDFTPARRKLLMSRIATGEYDAVIISHDHLGKIENDKDFEIQFIQNQIDEIKDAINSIRKEDSKSGMTVKQWEMTRQKLEYKMEALINKEKDDNISFLELGIDAMVVDEAHEFKNLQFHTSLQRIRGLGNPTGSQKAFDMYIKTQSLLEKTGNKNLIFLTGTPISNTIAEMFTVKRYLMADELKNDGLEHFDAWVKQYADIATDWELAASGKYKLVTRLSKFKNMPELMSSYGTFADIISIDTVKKQLGKEGKTLDIPTIKDGKPKNVIVERSEMQAEFIGVPDENGLYKESSLVYRSENLPKGKPQKGDDNMLVIMGAARKASLDMRLIDESYGDFKDSKVNKSIEDMLEIHKKWEDVKGVQLIFCDLSTPKGAVSGEKARIEKLVLAAERGDESAQRELDKISPDDLDALNSNFSVYDDIKAKLIAAGVPENEVVFIHDAKTKEQKESLFAKVNSGSIRFLLGSTSKMGAGMNVQKRLVGLHHLDVPWRPSDLEQREGRIIRQGNLLFSFYKLLKDNEYSLDNLKGNVKFESVVKEIGLKGDALGRAVLAAKEHGGEYEVTINRYATKNTLDSGLWEKIEAKASFIAQIKSGDIKDREVEDISGEAANAAEMKAAASGNPLIVEEMKLKADISKLEAIKKNFVRGLYDREARVEYYKKQVDSFKTDKSAFELDLNRVEAFSFELEADKISLEKLKADNKSRGISNKDVKDFSGFKVSLNDKVYTGREEAGGVMIKAGKDLLQGSDSFVALGSFAGFELGVERYSKFDNKLALLMLRCESGEYEDENIGSWIGNQKTAFNDGTLSAERVTKLLEFDKDFFKSQEEINQENWDEKLALLYRHREAGEKLAQTTIFEGENIGYWVGTQRQDFKNGKLSNERVTKLLEFDGDFFGGRDAVWDKKLELLYRHRETGEKLTQATVFEGESVGIWNRNQKKAFKDGILSPDRVAKLLEFDKDFFSVDVDLSAYGGSAGKEVKEVNSINNMRIDEEMARMSSGESGEAMRGLAERDAVMTTELS